MAHGYPDYGVAGALERVYQMLDSGELAARLGAESLFDRSGNIIFVESFEEGLSRWAVTEGAVGDDVSLAVKIAHRGGYSLALTTAGQAFNEAAVDCYVAYPAAARFGYEIACALGAQIEEFDFTLARVRSAVRQTCGVTWTAVGGVLNLVVPGGQSALVAGGVNLYGGATKWHVLKIVADFSTGIYVRLLIDNVAYNLAGRSLHSASAAGVADQLELHVATFGNLAQTQVSYVDDVIVTQNEP